MQVVTDGTAPPTQQASPADGAPDAGRTGRPHPDADRPAFPHGQGEGKLAQTISSSGGLREYDDSKAGRLIEGTTPLPDHRQGGERLSKLNPFSLAEVRRRRGWGVDSLARA